MGERPACALCARRIMGREISTQMRRRARPRQRGNDGACSRSRKACGSSLCWIRLLRRRLWNHDASKESPPFPTRRLSNLFVALSEAVHDHRSPPSARCPRFARSDPARRRFRPDQAARRRAGQGGRELRRRTVCIAATAGHARTAGTRPAERADDPGAATATTLGRRRNARQHHRAASKGQLLPYSRRRRTPNGATGSAACNQLFPIATARGQRSA